MQKQAPSFGRVLTMVLFALSCFGLLLFLWLSFGGPVPLEPKGYRVRIAFPEATQLAEQADVRVAGVSVGKVVSKERDPRGNRTIATIELDRRFAPLRNDARAILRQKTLLGETYVELTPGHRSAGNLPDGHLLARNRVARTVELDEIFDALDPQTRRAFQDWQRQLSLGIRGNGRNLNDVLGNLPAFASNANGVLDVLDVEHVAVRRLFRDTGTVFGALNSDQGQLRRLVTGSAAVFRQTAAEQRALADTFHVFPTFLDESRTTLARLQRFALTTDPLIRDLRPVARDLVPTLRDVRALSPDLRRLFVRLDPLIRASRAGLPALREVLDGARPLLGQVGPFLGQLTPILRWLELNQHLTADFIHNGAAGLASTTVSPAGGIGHYLRQFQPLTTPESLAVYPNRAATNRSNPYLPPLALAGNPQNQRFLFPFPAWDCKNVTSDGADSPPVESDTPGQAKAACYTNNDLQRQTLNQKGKFPHVTARSYRRP